MLEAMVIILLLWLFWPFWCQLLAWAIIACGLLLAGALFLAFPAQAGAFVLLVLIFLWWDRLLAWWAHRRINR